MNGVNRAVMTLAGAAIAGVLLWAAAHIGRDSTGGYWAAYGVVAAAGLVVALSHLRGRRGNPRLMLTLAFLPVLVAAGWVLIAMQPHDSWLRAHALEWSGDLGIRNVVEHVGVWLGVLAFGIGYTLGLSLEPAPPAPPAAPVVPPPTHDRAAADEPLTAERREVAEAENENEREPVR
jgi:hypothetical protein